MNLANPVKVFTVCMLIAVTFITIAEKLSPATPKPEAIRCIPEKDPKQP